MARHLRHPFGIRHTVPVAGLRPGKVPFPRASLMTTSAFVACWAVAVILGLYAVHCFWEAGRADLAAMSRGHGLQIAGVRAQLRPGASPASYRARACLALIAAGALALGVLLLAH